MDKRYLSDMELGQAATIIDVTQESADDSIARRLRDLGFIKGE